MALSVVPERKNRLIVLVPESQAGNLELAHKIFWMAIRDHCDVLYLALVDNDENSLSVSRAMATMKAMTTGDSLVVQTKLVQTAFWLKTLRALYQPGDRIVCHQEQSVKNSFLKTVPISTFLRDTLPIPITTISGFYNPQRIQVNQWMRSFIAWLGFLLILLGFTALEIRLDSLIPGVFGKVLLCIVLTIEIGVIWAWNLITD